MRTLLHSYYKLHSLRCFRCEDAPGYLLAVRAKAFEPVRDTPQGGTFRHPPAVPRVQCSLRAVAVAKAVRFLRRCLLLAVRGLEEGHVVFFSAAGLPQVLRGETREHARMRERGVM